MIRSHAGAMEIEESAGSLLDKTYWPKANSE